MAEKDKESLDTDRRLQFGSRTLTENDNVFSCNAWDNVKWDAEQEREAAEKVAQNSAHKLTTEECEKLQLAAPKYWDSFYNIHQNRFFKDRNWLFTEFPELAEDIGADGRRIFEIGCGVGNTILPLLTDSLDQSLKIYGCDFSSLAIDILAKHRKFDATRCELFVMDATDHDWTVPFEENSLDIVILIFVLSAIKPAKMQRVAENCFRYLKPGGLVMFRDYGRYDLAQLRLKDGKCLEDNFYVRGDGTFVYFFTNEEVKKCFCECGFEELQNHTDSRLQVNRSRMLKMYRMWIQAKYQKPK